MSDVPIIKTFNHEKHEKHEKDLDLYIIIE